MSIVALARGRLRNPLAQNVVRAEEPNRRWEVRSNKWKGQGSTYVPQPLREQIQDRLTPNLLIAYGITEIGTVSIAPPEMVRKIPGVVGAIVPGLTAEVVDEKGIVLPPETPGRLRIKGPGMIQSYFDAPEETQKAFRDGWFYSDDRVEFTCSGELIHHGRMDDMMIFDGVNINPVEIENVIG